MMMDNQPIDFFSDISEIFDIEPEYMDEAFKNYFHFVDLRNIQKAYYKHMVKKTTHRLPPELQRLTTEYL
jgi:hypothetical protein